MKVIFVDDVPNVARVGQTKEVADGYARNYLFPRKLAVLANSQAAAAVDAHLKKLVKQKAVEEAQMADLAKKISGLEITLRAKVGENEKLYGSITGADIAEALSKSAACVIDKKHIALAEPIKQAGPCDVTVKFIRDIQAVIKVNVIDENAPEPVKAEKKEEAPAPKAEKKEKAPAAEASEPKKEKKEKKPKAEKAAKVEKTEEPAAEVTEVKEPKAEKAEKAEKPAKEKKAKAEKKAEEKPAKAEKAEAPAAEAKEEKKEKKPRAKAKKEE